MDTSALKKFAQAARRQLIEQVAARMEQVLRTDSVEIREKAQVVEELKKQIAATSKEDVVDRVAYTWFNRFCALRFMDVNHYTRIGVVSPLEGHTQPEVLAEAKLGVIDESFAVDQARVFDLLNGRYPSSNPQQEAYRLLLVGASNAWHQRMPFLFPKIEDYTELLMPDDLLSENSVLQGVRETLTRAACEDVEVIGWLYQYYISERKDEVFAALKQSKKIEAGDIPAATQLFTPHWIVRYLVENSLGRLWMLNHPVSKLVQAMDYYIAPEQPETDFLRLGSPEEIRVADPACGSGHMLTYAFDLLYAIYEEEGYDPVEIPRLILEKNLYGIEIDKRAGDLAAFALTMKARAKDRRFFRRDVEPNICVLENVHFSASELAEYKKKIGNDLFTQDLWFLLTQFEQADNFGSLIRPQVKHPEQMLTHLEELGAFDDLLLYATNEKVKKVLKQAEYLSSRYHVVVANPPYMGGNGMNQDLRKFARDHYANNKSDMFAMFIDRFFNLLKSGAFMGVMTPFTWMFLDSYKKLREKVLHEGTLITLVRPEYHSFFDSAFVPICAYVVYNKSISQYKGFFIDTSNFYGADVQSVKVLEAINHRSSDYSYFASASDLKAIPGYPIAYWVNDIIRALYQKDKIGDMFEGKIGVGTSNDSLFIRMFWEVATKQVGKNKRWILIDKAGGFRKWYMGFSYVMDWENDGARIKNYRNEDGSLRSRPQNIQYLFREGVSWGMVGSGATSFRWRPEGYGFNNAAPALFGENVKMILASLNSNLMRYLLSIKGATLNMTTGMVKDIPLLMPNKKDEPVFEKRIDKAIQLEKKDWDTTELSWDFTSSPLLNIETDASLLAKSYSDLRVGWEKITLKLQEIEKELNQDLNKSYGVTDEVDASIPVEEISLTCNPYYRYGTKKNEEELETLLLEDTMQEFISYAVGCMFGRYSLDKPGLVLANAGEGLADYVRKVGSGESGVGSDLPTNDQPRPTIRFMPDADNVIPILDGEWFEDDIAERFKQFLKVTFGTEHYEENLAFIEDAIGRDIRSYFVKDFYKNHVKMYKKRPIYWLFSSPKGSFNALIYMHRYRPDTVSIILNGYLRQYREKLRAHKSHLQAVEVSADASQQEKTRAIKEGDKIEKVLAELKEYEDEILFPLAAKQLAIDLDDGVAANYPRFGAALAKVSGL